MEEIACTEGIDKDKVLACAASAKQHCTHPLARAILKAAHYAKIMVKGAKNAFRETGLGVRAMVVGRLVEVCSVMAGGNTAAFPNSCAPGAITVKWPQTCMFFAGEKGQEQTVTPFCDPFLAQPVSRPIELNSEVLAKAADRLLYVDGCREIRKTIFSARRYSRRVRHPRRERVSAGQN